MTTLNLFLLFITAINVIRADCPPSTIPESRPFLNIGHAVDLTLYCKNYYKQELCYALYALGGNPNEACENTLASTWAGLGSGMNGVELDVCMTKDKELFLWHDNDPWAATSLIRRLGIALPGQCSPSFSTNTKASKLTMEEVRAHYGYSKKNGQRSEERVPTLDHWLTVFGSDLRLEIIWIDVKVDDNHLLWPFVQQLKTLVNKHKINWQRILISVADGQRAALLRHLLHTQHIDGSRVFADTVSKHLFVLRPKRLNGVVKAFDTCSCCANLGAAPLATNRWSALQTTIQSNVRTRDLLTERGHMRKSVFVWTIDDKEEMEWILRTGVDGIITNRPDILATLIKTNDMSRIYYPSTTLTT